MTAWAAENAGAAQTDERGIAYVLDDDEQLCASLAWLLDSVNIRAECFTDAASFLATFDRERPACLILDVRMPEVGGFQVQEILNSSGIPLPVIFVSAHGDIRMSVRALQQGAVDFLEKPYDPQHMLEVVQRALGTARERHAELAGRRALEDRLAVLTPREREILRLVVVGVPSKAIAGRLGISLKTVDTHRARIREKTGAETLGALVGDILRSGVRLPEM
ncbi:response regulator transcription factor [Streptomyces viridochromogenes]|uniref:response regulator transcription factor n=1 Tax=Streptomyces viridochromogenes TaxID=1938 RepID=UPI000A4A2682|nr:response regulator [Streptomyces viridochromogenes]